MNISKETSRKIYKSYPKRDLVLQKYGLRYALQTTRALKTFETPYSNYRMELDFTKSSIFLYPTKKSKEPVLFHIGLAIDHNSKVIMGFTECIHPTAAAVVRLVKRAILPSLYFTDDFSEEVAKKLLNRFLPFGVCEIYAMDNGSEFIATTNISMFLELGGIPLLLPPARGDLKGSVERVIGTMERSWLVELPGFFENIPVTDRRYESVKEEAKKSAKYTLKEFKEFLLAKVVEYNEQPHPRITTKSRNQVWVDNLELNPISYPSNSLAIKMMFSLRYEAKLSNAGVLAGDNRLYNSNELTNYWNTKASASKVKVHVNPDDVRTAYIVAPDLDVPIKAILQNHQFEAPITMELYKVLFASSFKEPESALFGQTC